MQRRYVQIPWLTAALDNKLFKSTHPTHCVNIIMWWKACMLTNTYKCIQATCVVGQTTQCHITEDVWKVAECTQTERERVEKHHLALSQKTIKSPGGDNGIIPFHPDRAIFHSVDTTADTTLTERKRLSKSWWMCKMSLYLVHLLYG